MDQPALIETIGLTKDYQRVRAVDDLNLTLAQGEVFGFLGPNGAGKSTTLLMLLGLTRPSSGRALVCGLDPQREARKIKETVGYLPENVGFYGELTAEESLDYVAELNGIPPEEARKRILEALETVGLMQEENLAKPVGTFSRGMRQRLGIAEVLIKKPQILFLDEPTLGLDPEGAHRITELIRSLNKDLGISVLLSSHHLHHVQRISDRVGIMLQGRLVAEGSIQDLAEDRFGVDGENVTLEEIYMKYFPEEKP
jgi:ABC-2 type transport system ATP-binding protein